MDSDDPQTNDPAATRYGWRVVFVLLLVYVYAFVDRTLLALLIDPVRKSLHLSDTQISLLLGMAFAVFYCLCGLPAGYLADRWDRRRLIGAGSVGWSLMTILCGTAGTAGQLLVGRMGVGIAESVISPTCLSLIRDAVPRQSRALAYSVYGMGAPVGVALSLVGGGFLIHAAEQQRFAGLPLIGALQPWQITLIVTGLFGLPLSLLLFTVREPRRHSGGVDPARGLGVGAALLATARYLGTRRSVYGPLFAFATFAAMINFSALIWLPTALSRHWHLPPAAIGTPLGTITFFSSTAGLAVGGWLMKRLLTHGRSVLPVGATVVLVSGASIAAAFLVPDLTLSYAALVPHLFVTGVSFAVAATVLSEVTPAAMMGQVGAMFLSVQNIIGQSVGPLLVPALSDGLLGGPSALPGALGLTIVGYAVLAVISIVWLERSLGRVRLSADPAVRLAPQG